MTGTPTPSSGRLFSDEELRDVGRSPWMAAADAIRQGHSGAARGHVLRAQANFRAKMDRYRDWVGSISSAVVDRWGHAGATMLAVATRRFFAATPDLDVAGGEDPASIADAIGNAGGTPDADLSSALVALDQWLARWRCTIDLHRDWISALLGAVYRTHGPDALEAVLRACGSQGLMASVEEFNRRDPRDRLVTFVSVLHGHFAELSLAEDERKFTITQDPCGTCTRQILDGRLDPPLSLPVVEQRHRTTWGRGSTTVYRSHVPIWHVEMARERFGVPWPVSQCPSGIDGRPCRILLYKEPYDPEANEMVPSPDTP